MQFDVFANPVTAARKAYPLVITLQSDLLSPAVDLVVAPLAPRSALPGMVGRLSPVVQIEEADYAVLIRSLTNLPARDCLRPISNLSAHREALLGAVDLLFYGV